MKRPQLAAIVTEYRRYSHAQHIIDRFLWGYGWGGRHHHPPMDVVALYTDQLPQGDLSRERAKRFPSMKIYPTIAEALTRGGPRLAVDGVLLIGEHGSYPRNDKGQRLYPRYEFFQQIVDVFRDSGRAVPVFNDKHLSWNWSWAQEMVQTARAMGFGLMAGSSLPVARRLPAIDMPWGAPVGEAMCVAVGGPDGYDIHALEAIQSMVERRRDGETGVDWLQALRGDSVWKAMTAGSWDAGGWNPGLFQACICRSHQLQGGRPGFQHSLPAVEQLQQILARREQLKPGQQFPDPVAYRYQHSDGLKITMLLLEGIVEDFTFAAQLADRSDLLSLQMHLAPREVCNFFSPLVNHIETLFLTGRAPYPIQRTLLTTGLTAAGIESLWRRQQRIPTPHLDIAYQATRHSTFWNN